MAETQTALVSLLVAGMGPCPVTTVCLPSTTTELRSMRSLCNLDPSCTISIMISSPRRAIEPPLIDHRTRPFFLSFLHLLIDFSLIFPARAFIPLVVVSFLFFLFYYFILLLFYFFIITLWFRRKIQAKNQATVAGESFEGAQFQRWGSLQLSRFQQPVGQPLKKNEEK